MVKWCNGVMVRPCVGVMVKQYSLLEGGKMVIPVSISTPYLPPQIGRIHSGLTSTLPSHTSEVHRNYQSFFPTHTSPPGCQPKSYVTTKNSTNSFVCDRDKITHRVFKIIHRWKAPIPACENRYFHIVQCKMQNETF